MTESAKRKTRVLVICTQHEIQRHQDMIPQREKERVEFEKRLRQIIDDLKISLVAEEAGDDREAWERLKRDEGATPREFEKLFEGTEAVDKPLSTIAKKIANERPTELRHEDIRPPNADEIKIVEQYDEAMVQRIMGVLGTAEEVLVIIGEDHCEGVRELLKKEGLIVE